VHYNDINGALGLGDKALFWAGVVQFFNENYREADHFLSQIPEFYPQSPHAADAVELAIIAKTMSTGGADYDGRKVAEARALVATALKNYPSVAARKEEFLEKKLLGITVQQAEKDYRMAEFWRRTGHPGSAWFYYKLVQKRYPGTKQAELSAKRMEEIRTKLAKEGKPVPDEQAAALPAPPREEQAPRPRQAPNNIGPPPGPLPSLEPGRPLR
jgi:outer membrane protein assembly factor BamD (BamD/ComL family)